MDTQNKVIQIVVADSQFMVTESLKVILKKEPFYVCKIVNSFEELHQGLNMHTFDLLITDFTLLDNDSLEPLRLLKQKYPQLAILILTNAINKNELIELTRLGIKNIIYKTAAKEELFNAIEATLKGKKFFTSEILDIMLELGEKKSRHEDSVQLTSSEVEIVRLIAQGFTTKVIAARKCISFHTVMTHRKNIFRKLGINSASELFMYAVKARLIDTLEYHI